MSIKRRTYVRVAKYCLLEAMKVMQEEGAVNLCLGKEDDDWLVSYTMPDISKTVEPVSTSVCPIAEQDIVNITKGVSNG